MPDNGALYDRFLQWGMRNIAGPIAPGMANFYQQQALQAGQNAQQQQNQYLGPEAQGHNPLVRFGHGLASVGYDTLGGLYKAAGGAAGMNPGQALLTAANPALGTAVMGAQSAPGFWGQAGAAIQNPTPDNVQNALFGGSMLAGAGAAAGMGAPVGTINPAAQLPLWQRIQAATGNERGVATPDMLTGGLLSGRSKATSAINEADIAQHPQVGRTNISPSMYLNKVGGDADSILQTPEDHAVVNSLAESYRNGAPVPALKVLHDESGNLLSADGRHRALAAQIAGVDRIPVDMHRQVSGVDTNAIAQNYIQQLQAPPSQGPLDVLQGANDFNTGAGRSPLQVPQATPNPNGASIADAYEAMPHDPTHPAVQASYEALKGDINSQWDFATKNLGVNFEPWTKEGQPYANSKEMMNDVLNNQHLSFFQGGELPEDHPLAGVDPQTGLSYNDKFRAVHDLFGHAANGFQFGAGGEEGAYLTHAQMMSPESIPALTNETRGQNNWVNFGPHMRDAAGNLLQKTDSGFLPASQRPYAQNKTGMLPSWTYQDALPQTQAPPASPSFWQRIQAATGNERGFATPDMLTGGVLGGPKPSLKLNHWSNEEGLTETDPAYFGTGKAGAERARQSDPNFLPRTYFGMDGYREPAIQGQRFQYTANVDPQKYYDIAKDPEGVWQQGWQSGGASGAEAAVKNAGYSGYHHDGVVASFDKVPVSSANAEAPIQWPAAYTNSPTSLSSNNGGGANYSAADLAAFKAKHGIPDAPSAPAPAMSAARVADDATAFDPSTFGGNEPGPSNILAPFGTTPAARFKSVVPDSVAQHLTPGWENLLKSPISQRSMLDLRGQMAPPSEVEAAAQLGQGSSFNWYPMSRQLGSTLEESGQLPTGVNSNTLHGTLAATSPQTNVPRNLAESLELMHNLKTQQQTPNGFDPTADPQAFSQFLESSPLTNNDKITLPYGGDITLAGSKRLNINRAMAGQPLGGMKVSSFWGDLNQGNFGTMDSISQKGMGAGLIYGEKMGNKIFQPAPYIAARSIMSDVAAKHGVSVDQIQASQWTPSRMINDSAALQQMTPKDAISHITEALGQEAPSSDYAHIALDALDGKHNTDSRYAGWKKDYERVNQALRELHGNDQGKINDFTDALRTRLKPLEAERATRPLGEPTSRSLGRVIGRTQRSILAAGKGGAEE